MGDWIVYTYLPGRPGETGERHAYGPASEEEAKAKADALVEHADSSAFSVMALSLAPLSLASLSLQGATSPLPAIHPATAGLLPFFEHAHLPAKLAAISQPFHALAHHLAESLDGPEVTVALRKLLEAKDCAVRAAL